jgi:hypothetical protein
MTCATSICAAREWPQAIDFTDRKHGQTANYYSTHTTNKDRDSEDGVQQTPHEKINSDADDIVECSDKWAGGERRIDPEPVHG